MNDKGAPTLSRQQLGLPEGDYQLLGMFDEIAKVKSDVWAMWMQIMRELPNTRLWILDPGPERRKSLALAAQKLGVASRRIICSPPVPVQIQAARNAHCRLILGASCTDCRKYADEVVSLLSHGLAMDWGAYRVAVVTPYFRVEPRKLAKCCESVLSQSFRCDHILVADGEPQDFPSNPRIIHLVLPHNIGNNGASPRGIGAQYAFVQGYDAVAFLDADNWYETDHIERAVKPLENEGLDVVFSRRHIVFPDGEVLAVEDPEDFERRHVDTSCYVFSKRAAYLLSIWAMYPKDFGAIEDRIMLKVIMEKNISYKFLSGKTVWYETNWPLHYSLARKKPTETLHRLKNRPSPEAIAAFLRSRCGFTF